MKFVLLILYTISFQGILGETVNEKNKCECSKLYTIEECNINCEWNQVAGECSNQTLPLIRKSYCSYQKDNCNKTIGCANYNGICVPFTGCTAIKQNTNYACQQYSEICITDGSKCVEKGVCANYKTRFSCRNNYVNYEWQGFCFWDKKECRDALACNELSYSLKNDAECRKQLSWCTFKLGGGCEDSGELCKDQKFQQQCVTNRKGDVKCYWDGQACFDFSCKYITKDCVKNGCSMDKDSKCIDRLECSEYTIEQSCTYNKSNVQCMWENKSCQIKSCENASLTRQSNQACQEINSNCITQFGGGCKVNGECDQANNKIGCQQNVRGENCYWNGYQCVLKQCQWAPASFRTATLCKNFQSNCVYNGKVCIEDGCYAQQTQSTCQVNRQCQWQSKCDVKTCETAGRDINYTSHLDCWNYMTTCTLNDQGMGCMMIKYSCNQYTREIQCYQSTQSKCSWYKNQCLDSKCEYLNYTTHYECNNYLSSCTTDGTTCIYLKSLCKLYTSEKSCTINSQNQPCIWQNAKCAEIACDLIPKTEDFNTHSECNLYQPYCTVLEQITGCIVSPTECSLLNQSQCYGSKCIYSNGVCRDKQCQDYKGDITQSNCEAFLEGKKCMRGPNLIPTGCVDKVDQCTNITNEYQCNEGKDKNNNKCRWVYSFCINWNQNVFKQVNNDCVPYPATKIPNSSFCITNKTCLDAGIATVEYTDEICENYLLSCKKNTVSACMDKGLTSFPSQCNYYVSRTNCITLSNCFWSNSTGCQEIKGECSSITNQEDCDGNKDISGTFCKWQTAGNLCQNICETLTSKNLQCSTLDSKCVLNSSDTTKCIKKKANCSDYALQQSACADDDRCVYNVGTNLCVERKCTDLTDNLTHLQCIAYKSECTVAYPGGCSNLQPNCSNYLNQRQCNLNDKSKICYWYQNKGCSDKICSEIVYNPLQPKTQCQAFFNDLVCNLNSSENGCEDLKDSCSKYKNEKQCFKQLDGYECMWLENTCIEASCEKTKLSSYSHIDCSQQYTKLRCTVNGTNDGCMDQSTDCKRYKTQDQCKKTMLNEDCIWNQLYQECNFKSCKDEIPENQKCSDYLSICVEPNYTCRNSVCEDYLYDNDQDCKMKDSKCTSNGRFCIQRGTCEQNLYQQACNIDINNKYCGWNSAKKQCRFLQCQEAPLELIYTQDCESYFPNQNCITKLGGGCTIARSCLDYTTQSQCDESSLFECIWENQNCRSKICKDYRSGNLLDCRSKLQNCTTDGSTCVELRNCAQLSQENCTIGTEGNCLYLNGQCLPYQKCQSISYTSHQECFDSLQNQCTTDGTKCVPITSCDEYSLKLQCIKGLEGDCAWENNKCSKFSSCDSYHYKTHQECYSINQNCTTDTVSQCIKLMECSKYPYEENCKFDQSGIVKSNGLVTKLNTCLWKDRQCSNITCVDLYGTDHSRCYQQLSTCTSDGVKCMNMEKACSSYLNSVCSSAFSQEGKCALVDSICTVFDCSSVTVETQCKALSNCQFINKLCQPYRKCQEYTTEKDCTKGTDGQCLFKNSKCSAMSNCSDANQQQFCDTKSCYWNTTSSACQSHTCQTYGLQNPCGSFYNFQKTQLIFCAYSNADHACKDISPTIFGSADCYTKSLGYFSNRNDSCTSCVYQPQSNTTIPNNNETKNDTKNNEIGGILVHVILIGLLITI
ncbi:unnamed protein product [Paramecium octaurelia]|uniref:PSI domain-containing protein n=1 Tax=Paramecium octaurelia TaxID=43137 RepID=A0A8S1UY88_PAROT|nr:unnamed protein product [Paramecium octaurelia]